MRVLGIYGSPRKKGVTDRLLDQVLEGVEAAGGEVKRVYVRDLKISGCLECGGCDETGTCVVEDDMQEVYPLLQGVDVVVLAFPVFFYGPPAQTKALIDRAQALWSKRMLEKDTEGRRRYDTGKGYVVVAGATKGKRIFEGCELTARYFYDALDRSYEGGLFFRRLEKASDLDGRPEVLAETYAFGKGLLG